MYLRRDRARGRPIQSLPASRRVVWAHSRGGDRARSAGTGRACRGRPAAPCGPRRIGGESGDPVASGRRDLGAARGDASVLQPVEGVRAREAIVRITDASSGVEKIKQVEVYAEGDVRLSGAPTSALPAYRGTFRTTEVQLKSYDKAGPKTVKDPPLDLSIIRRSGFLAQKRAGAGQTTASGELLRVRGPGGSPVPSMVSESPTFSSSGSLVATQAVTPNSAATLDGEQTSPARAIAQSSGGTGPRRDPLVQRAGFASVPATAGAIPKQTSAAPVDPQVQLARAASSPGWCGTAAGCRFTADRR